MVIADDGRLRDDPVGQRALRQWLARGGKIWVLLDRVDPERLVPLLGDSFGFQVVDRVSLTTVAVRAKGSSRAADPPREFEQPVDLVRVVVAEDDRVLQEVEGWPASFVRQVGRGQILFTTLGGAAWYRPRTPRDGNSPFANFAQLPVALRHFEELIDQLQFGSATSPIPSEVFKPLVLDQIGYSVLDLETVASIFGGFLLTLVVAGVGLRRWGRAELLGWLAPASALATAVAFFVLGETGRRAVPPTVAVGQVVQPTTDGSEAIVDGLVGVYRPQEGTVRVAADGGGVVSLDTTGLEGQIRRLVLTDTEVWHWENLALPAGVRLGGFHYALRTREPLAAVARFGPDGLEGRLTAGPFTEPADALIHTASGYPLALQLKPDGSFRVTSDDFLTGGQYLAGAVLTDKQQRRQEVYRQLLADPARRQWKGRDVVLAWAEAGKTPYTVAGEGTSRRTAQEGRAPAGSALLAVPLHFEPSAPGSSLTIPIGFIPFQRSLNGLLVPLTLQTTLASDMELRFQLPESVLPLKVERATLLVKVRAPGRRVSLGGYADGKPVPLRSVHDPLEAIRLEIAEERLLRADEQGGLHFNITISEQLSGGDRITHWNIDYLGLEVVGQRLKRAQP